MFMETRKQNSKYHVWLICQGKAVMCVVGVCYWCIYSSIYILLSIEIERNDITSLVSATPVSRSQKRFTQENCDSSHYTYTSWPTEQPTCYPSSSLPTQLPSTSLPTSSSPTLYPSSSSTSTSVPTSSPPSHALLKTCRIKILVQQLCLLGS